MSKASSIVNKSTLELINDVLNQIRLEYFKPCGFCELSKSAFSKSKWKDVGLAVAR